MSQLSIKEPSNSLKCNTYCLKDEMIKKTEICCQLGNAHYKQLALCANK